jgi:glycosyltransferase involved in cell wall biosynthesis
MLLRSRDEFAHSGGSLTVLFWLSFGGVAYAYFGYPLLLMVWGGLRPSPIRTRNAPLPAISIILPVHNEASQLGERIDELLRLHYPSERLELVIVSDGSTDGTVGIAEAYARRDHRVRVVVLGERQGKGGAINAGLATASHDIVVFIDAGISLETHSVEALVRPFADPRVGSVSGEDHIAGGGGEGLYGRYELFLRQRESMINSIVGASGSFYAQRKGLCPTFREGFAPDFLAVLHAVDHGYRAVTEPRARGP